MERYHEIFEKIPDGVTLHDATDGTIVDTNQEFCEMLDYSRAELLELDFGALHPDEPPYTSDRAAQYIRKAATEGPQTFEWVDLTKDGDRLPVEVNLRRTAIDDEPRILAVVRDITERKQRERDLQRERDRANALFEHLGEPAVEVTFHDETAVVQNVNAAFQETFGVTAADIVGESIVEQIVPDSQRAESQSLLERVRSGEFVESEFQRATPSGERTFLLRTVPYSLDGETRAYGIYFDVTERQRQEERFQTFIQQSSDVISVLAADGTIHYQSPSAERILGYDPAEMVGEVAFEYVHPKDRAAVTETFAAAANDPTLNPTAEYRFQHADGSWIWLESVGNNQLDNPPIEGFVVNSRDVTDRKRHERALERQNERLDEFASVVSHDLRNPLNVASGRLQLAMDDCDSEKLEAVAAAHDRMETLIEDVLTLARAGESLGEREPVDLEDTTVACWQSVDTASNELVAETDAVVMADGTRLRQLLENLFRNAVEHSSTNPRSQAHDDSVDHCERDVTVRVGDLDDGFYVADDGPGIPEAERETVFEPGYSTQDDGTGFGLNIVQQIATGHGWRVDVTDSEAGGARFEITGVQFEAESDYDTSATDGEPR